MSDLAFNVANHCRKIVVSYRDPRSPLSFFQRLISILVVLVSAFMVYKLGWLILRELVVTYARFNANRMIVDIYYLMFVPNVNMAWWVGIWTALTWVLVTTFFVFSLKNVLLITPNIFKFFSFKS